jgi:hypothetical protein
MARALLLFLCCATASAACSVSLSEQLSTHDCKLGTGYGCFENNTMWADGGCRGVFTCNGVDGVRCDPCDPGPCSPSNPPRGICKCVPPPPTPAPPPAPSTKYMLLDDRNIADAGTAEMVLGTVKKHPAGAMISEDPKREYEMRFDNMQPNVWYDPQLKKWRCWYSSFTSCAKPQKSIPFCDNEPATCGSKLPTTATAGRGSGFLYAESDDGIAWTKPDLNLTDWKGDGGKNNLLELDGMTTGVYLDEETKDPQQRYKIATGSNGKGGLATSPDGIHWSAVKDLEAETHARWDTPKNVIWDPARKQWILMLRASPTEQNMRVQSLSNSLTDDFMGDWAPAQPTGLNTSLDYQPDGLLAFPYEGIFLGIGNVFNPTQEVAANGAVIGQVNMVMGWSADGRKWKWIRPNDSIIPLGKAGDFDSCGVFSAKQDPLRTAAMFDGTLRLYYTGCNGPFFSSRGCALGMAELQRDHFAGLRGGTVQAAPARVQGRTLRVSVDGGAAGVQIGILGDSSKTVENCDPIKGAVTDAVVTWKGESDISHYINGAITVVFKIPGDATAYAFRV